MNGRAKRVAPPTADFGSATWTRDGRYLVGSGSSGLAWIGASGGAAHALIDIKAPTAPWSFAPDGRLAYSTNSPTTALDMWTTPITTSDSGLRAGAPVALLHSPFYEAYPAFSPDGRWFAYTSNEGGPWEIYVRSVSDSTVKIQVSRGGGRVPRWSQAHSELFYATDDQRLMVATYAVRNGEFSVGASRQWTASRLAETDVFPNYDVAADGRRIVALLPFTSGDGGPPGNHVTMIFNFVEELKRRVH